MSSELNVATLVVSCLLPFQPLIAQELSQRRGEEARLWIATSDRILGIGLGSEDVHFEAASPEGVRSLAVDRQGRSLWILRDQNLERIDLRELKRAEVVAAIAAQTPGSCSFSCLPNQGFASPAKVASRSSPCRATWSRAVRLS